jgi:hypothetical protein
LAAATHDAVVVFEVDDVDPATYTGWSVLVTGVARPVTDPAAAEAMWAAGVPSWLPDQQGVLVVLSTDWISGRRFLPPAAAGSRPVSRVGPLS